jgi:hypothetical protein
MELGGLGVLDLITLGSALRLRWEWQAKITPDKPWASFATKPERAVQAMFDLGDGGSGQRPPCAILAGQMDSWPLSIPAGPGLGRSGRATHARLQGSG